MRQKIKRAGLCSCHVDVKSRVCVSVCACLCGSETLIGAGLRYNGNSTGYWCSW